MSDRYSNPSLLSGANGPPECPLPRGSRGFTPGLIPHGAILLSDDRHTADASQNSLGRLPLGPRADRCRSTSSSSSAGPLRGLTAFAGSSPVDRVRDVNFSIREPYVVGPCPDSGGESVFVHEEGGPTVSSRRSTRALPPYSTPVRSRPTPRRPPPAQRGLRGDRALLASRRPVPLAFPPLQRAQISHAHSRTRFFHFHSVTDSTPPNRSSQSRSRLPRARGAPRGRGM